MPDLAAIVQSGAATAWLYLPIAVVLGALHALEPGHAKSLMAAYIIAIRGTPAQAVLLALSAAVGHTIVVWGLVLAAFWIGERYVIDKAEPWLALLSGVLVVALALRMLWGLMRRDAHRHRHRGHGHDHSHDHDHDHAHGHSHEPPKPGTHVTTGQIVWFGFTGGLLPCPSAIAVLLICLQIKAFTLGVAMVAAFSAGLALTLVSVGLAVVWSHGRLSRSLPQFDRLAARLPYLSGALVLAVGVAMTVAGLNATGVLAGKL